MLRGFLWKLCGLAADAIGQRTQVLDVLVTENLDNSLLSGGHSSRAETSTVCLVNNDSIGSRSAEESKTVGDVCAGSVCGELKDSDGVTEGSDEEGEMSCIYLSVLCYHGG